jgi:hypothetical protein
MLRSDLDISKIKTVLIKKKISEQHLLLKRYFMPKTIMVTFEMAIGRVQVVSNKLFGIL